MKAETVEGSRPVETPRPVTPPSSSNASRQALGSSRLKDSEPRTAPVAGGLDSAGSAALESPHPFPFLTQRGDVLGFLPLLSPGLS